MDNTPPYDSDWPDGWEEHKRQQLRRLASRLLSEKLVWLEQAHRMVLHLASQRAKKTSDSPDI